MAEEEDKDRRGGEVSDREVSRGRIMSVAVVE